MKFYLGTHEPTWLSRSHVPLFVSAVRLRLRCKRKLPVARVPWALDSGGFSVLSKHGGYPQSAAEYAAEVRRWSARIGNLDWAAIQDWMCEPQLVERTGLSVLEHQRRTVRNWLDLRRLAPEMPWIPVIQGYTRAEYLRCVELYAEAGTDLTRLPVVGIGSVCRREDTAEAEVIIHELARRGIRLHGFGFKLGGLDRCRDVLASADSLAWSDGARRKASAARRYAARMARGPSLFECEQAAPPDPNSPRVALDWLSHVEVRAGLKDDSHLAHPCPFCTSSDVHPPHSSSLDFCCADCGASWGDVREPSLV